MATLTSSLATGDLWSAPYKLTVRVDGIDFIQPNKVLTIAVEGPSVLYSWTDGVIFAQPVITQDTVVGADYLIATITIINIPPPATLVNFTLTYSDAVTPEIALAIATCFGNVTPLARSPAPNQIDAPVIEPLVVALSVEDGLEFRAGQIYLNDVPTLDESGTPLRPDFSGSLRVVGNFLSGKVVSRRAFDEGAPITVRWPISVTPDNERVFNVTLEWTFHTARRVTKLLDPTFQRTKLDRPSPSGVVELFRQTALDALVPQRSTAAPTVVFFYAVQQSSLASLTPLLPDANQLAPETLGLLPDDIASPVEAAAKLDNVAIFWTSLLQVLIRDAALPPPITELLDRAWNSEYPADRGGAIAAALLYAVQSPL